MKSLGRTHPVGSFFVLAFVLTWIIGLAVLVFVQVLFPQPYMTGVSNLFGKFGPTLAGIVMAYVVAGKAGLWRLSAGLFRFKNPPKWYLVAVLLPFVLVLVSIGLHRVFGGEIKPDWKAASWSSLGPIFLTKMFLGGGLGEELGWRGFALPQLQIHFSGLTASIIIGFVWAFWHLPAYLLASDSDGEMPFLLFLIFVIAGSVVLAWLFNSTGGNLLLAVLFHAALNTAFSFFEFLIPTSAGQINAMAWCTGLFTVLAFVITACHGPTDLSNRNKVIWNVGSE